MFTHGRGEGGGSDSVPGWHIEASIPQYFSADGIEDSVPDGVGDCLQCKSSLGFRPFEVGLVRLEHLSSSEGEELRDVGVPDLVGEPWSAGKFLAKLMDLDCVCGHPLDPCKVFRLA